MQAGTLAADVAVVGGGPAGSVAALVLARAGLEVILVERGEAAPFRAGEMLSPAAGEALRALGLFGILSTGVHLVSPAVRSAWGGSELLDSDLIFDARGPGWHLERRSFDAALLAAAVAAGARARRATRVEATSFQRATPGRRERARLHLHRDGAEPQALDVRAVIDCSGRAACVAREAGVVRRRYDNLVALAGLLSSPRGADPESATLVEAVEDGWWYSARLPGQRRVAVYLTDGDLWARHAAPREDQWRARLSRSRHVRERVEAGRYELCAPLVAQCADSSRLVRLSGAGWVAAGDAAAARDPLSAEGLLHALDGGREAALALIESLAGRRHALAAYERRQHAAYREYLRRRQAYYALETRYRERPFWRRRRG